MAENWASRVGGIAGDRARNFFANLSNAARHPGQTAIRAGGRVIGGLFGPIGALLGGQAADYGVNRYSARQVRNDSLGMIRDASNALDSQIWGGTPQMTANPISYGGMSGITSPQRGSYPTPQGPQQSALASMLGLNNYQGNSPGSGLPGITSPNPYSNGDNGSAGQNTSPATMLQPIGSAPPPNQISGGGARDAFAGTSGSSDWGNTFASLGMQGSSGGSHNSMAGPTAIADSLQGQSALRNRLREQLRQNPNDQSALNLRAQMIANRGGSN